ncbi:MAG: sigma 54-interacting transcriptional regulator [Polyangiaceae bacterium]
MENLLSKLIDRLARAEAFEEAGDAALGTAIEIVKSTITASSFAKSARVLRAIIHHRPDDGYRRIAALAVAENGSLASVKLGDPSSIASASAWQWVRGHETSAAIDLTTGTVVLSSAASAAKGVVEGAVKSVARDATHLFVVPVRAPGRRIDGMLVVEASCKAASGTPFVWESCREALSLVAAVVAPFLARLPVTHIERMAPEDYLPVVGQSMQSVVEVIRAFAKQDDTLLFVGPAGAGKASLARWAHHVSASKSGPFEMIHLAEVSDEHQLAELFGARKPVPQNGIHGNGAHLASGNGAHGNGAHLASGNGAHGNGAHLASSNGAAKDALGCVARAEKGTLFIDEADRLTPAAQSALLRLLEEKRYRVAGDGDDKPASVRLIFGTNADLKKLVDEGKFRADLFYRIDHLPVRIAPLRERPDEIIEWAEYMLHRRHAATGVTSEATITQEAAGKLVKHDWPGNLRQLDAIIRRAYALAQIDHSSAADGIGLRAEHIDRALQYEGKGSPRTLLDHLDSAAEAFVAEAERRTETGIRLDMDLADSFKGLVIEAAKRRWSPEDKDAVKKAFLLLGKEATVKSRNHWATYEREFDKVQELRRVLAGGERTPKHHHEHAGHGPSAHASHARHT